MGIFRLIGAYVAFAWRFSLMCWWRLAGIAGRPSALLVFLFLILFPVGALLMLFGFNLDDVDRWLDAHGGVFDAVGTILFRAACALVMLVCAIALLGALLDRKNPDRPGLGCALAALVVGYFAWFGMIG